MDQRGMIRIDSDLRLPRSGLVQQLFIQKLIFQVLFNFCLNQFKNFGCKENSITGYIPFCRNSIATRPQKSLTIKYVIADFLS